MPHEAAERRTALYCPVRQSVVLGTPAQDRIAHRAAERRTALYCPVRHTVTLGQESVLQGNLIGL